MKLQRNFLKESSLSMQKIEIKPNDQSMVGKIVSEAEYFDKPCWVEILFVGNESIFWRSSELGEGMSFLRGGFILKDEPPVIDWSNVKFARGKLSGDFYRVNIYPRLSFTKFGNEYEVWGNIEEMEPIKFTQTLKVGDIVKSNPTINGIRGVGSVRAILDNWFIISPMDPFDLEKYKDAPLPLFEHSDDWELVNYSVGCIGPVAKNEFGDWVEKVCSEKKQTRLAPALLSYDKGCSYFPSSKFYSSLEKAEEDNKSIDRMPEILWPAILNQDGFYTVPEGE